MLVCTCVHNVHAWCLKRVSDSLDEPIDDGEPSCGYGKPLVSYLVGVCVCVCVCAHICVTLGKCICFC